MEVLWRAISLKEIKSDHGYVCRIVVLILWNSLSLEMFIKQTLFSVNKRGACTDIDSWTVGYVRRNPCPFIYVMPLHKLDTWKAQSSARAEVPWGCPSLTSSENPKERDVPGELRATHHFRVFELKPAVPQARGSYPTDSRHGIARSPPPAGTARTKAWLPSRFSPIKSEPPSRHRWNYCGLSNEVRTEHARRHTVSVEGEVAIAKSGKF